ncbi:MAG: tetratricopeptide repeat protein [Fuerstiella sp.]
MIFSMCCHRSIAGVSVGQQLRFVDGIKLCLLSILAFVLASESLMAASIRETRALLASGNYSEALDLATAEVERRSYSEEWPLLKAQAQISLGRYSEAAASLEAGLTRYAWSIRLRMATYDLQTILGDRDQKKLILEEVNQLATSAPWRYTDADDLVVLGHAALELGADPKDVLEGFFERARRNYSSRSDGMIASARLALEKQDPALAASYLRPAIETFPEDAEVAFLLSEALKTGSAEESAELLQKTLQLNPNHFEARLRLVRQSIDREMYEPAKLMLEEIFQVNPALPKAWALKAVVFHLQNDSDQEQVAVDTALQFSPNNPEVTFLIGECLSRKYRFAEAAEYLNQSLKADADYLPAKIQLAQDLLRLGRDAEGWKLVAEAGEADDYSVGVFNLLQLKDSIDNYVTLKDERFLVRMERTEASVYGSQVQVLLNSAFDTLSEKYGYVPTEPVIVEIFDRKDDFAVRTFGVPDVAGYLGVCFGRLITANSPASFRSSPNNWQAVLWHEFCHVITLQMTGNRIPRWLSEGTSVYEERQRNGSWGQHMSPVFQDRILNGEITPVSELSSAFLNAKSGADVNFAYYESSMVVEYLVQEFGFESITAVLGELKNGLPINDALQRHTTDMQALDRAFESWLKERATEFAPNVAFAIAKPRQLIDPVVPDITDSRPNYSTVLQTAVDLVQIDKLDDAAEMLQGLVELYPNDRRPDSARTVLASIYGQQDQVGQQIDVLQKQVELSASDWDSAYRLLQLLVKNERWEEAAQAGQQVLAIDPLRAEPNQLLLKATSQVGNMELSQTLLAGLLELDTANAARYHLQLAKLQLSQSPQKARRHVLQSLELAPRYREAHQFLLSLPVVKTEGRPAVN